MVVTTAVENNEPIFMLPSDYRRLEQTIGEYDEQYRRTLAGTAETTNISSETWHDNPAFDEVQQQAKMSFSQLKKFQAIKNSAVVVHTLPEGGRVAIGSRVMVSWNQNENDLDTLVLTGYIVPGSPEEEVSTTSPLGSLLLNAQSGDTIKGTLNGRSIELKVHAVEPASEYFE